jgi:hypothetical protein
MSQEYLSLPGFVPIREVAAFMGISGKRVLQLVMAQRLPARKVQGRYLVPVEAIASFERAPHGRIRTSPAPWRRYRAGAVVSLRRIDAPIRPGCEQALSERIAAMAEAGAHTFAGTMARYIWIASGVLSLVLIWKSTEASPVAIECAMEALRDAIEGYVVWEMAMDSTAQVVAHT